MDVAKHSSLTGRPYFPSFSRSREKSQGDVRRSGEIFPLPTEQFGAPKQVVMKADFLCLITALSPTLRVAGRTSKGPVFSPLLLVALEQNLAVC